MTETLSVRIPREEAMEIEKISRREKTTKSAMLREIVERGMKDKKLAIALDKFLKKEATAWRAARIAGIPLTEFLDIAKEKGLELHYTEEELKEEFAEEE